MWHRQQPSVQVLAKDCIHTSWHDHFIDPLLLRRKLGEESSGKWPCDPRASMKPWHHHLCQSWKKCWRASCWVWLPVWLCWLNVQGLVRLVGAGLKIGVEEVLQMPGLQVCHKVQNRPPWDQTGGAKAETTSHSSHLLTCTNMNERLRAIPLTGHSRLQFFKQRHSNGRT